MAYRFNGIDEQMQGEESGKQNIFDPSAGGGQTAQGGGGDTFSSGGGAAAPSGGGGGSGMGAPQAPAGRAPSSGQASAFKANSQRAAAPSQKIQGIQGSLAASNQKLQDEANTYSAKADEKAGSYGADKVTLGKAADGDDKALQSTVERLGQGGPETFEGFAGLEADTPDAADALLNPSEIYRSGSGAKYTAGLGRYDSALLRNNQDFRQIQSQLLGEQDRITKESDKMAKEQTESARKRILEGYEKGTNDIRDYLGTLSEDTLAAAKEKERNEDLRRQSLSPESLSKEKYGEIQKKIKEDFANADPTSSYARALPYLDEGPMDLSKYFNIDRDTDYLEFLGQGEVYRYNRINGLLGNKGEALQFREGGAGDDYSFDEQSAYQNIMDQIVGKRRQQDEVEAAEKEQMRIAAEKTAKETAKKTREAIKKRMPKMKAGGYKDYGQGVQINTAEGKVIDPLNILT